ncbi:hypothetical protein [Spiribacter roseus]|uniref:Uncharacterized protein n=1 Tax=Spiribacter roseus TaxID=1855875 RepID=A0ABV3RZS6_9GAMM
MLAMIHRSTRRILMLSAVAIALAGCRADEVELTVNSTQLRSALAGNEVVAEFQAVFTHDRPLNTRQSAQVDDVWSVLDEYMDISDFSRENVDGGLKVTIEGEIPVRTSRTARDAYYLSLTESRTFNGLHRVTLQAGEQFEAMREALAAVNFELDMAQYHPTVMTVTGRSSRLIAPSAAVADEAHLVYEDRLDGSVSFRQAGEGFDQTGPGFFIRLDG